LAGRRITLIANELRGLYPAGGMGTATSFLALALARMGHSVELLIAWQAERPLDPYWERTYVNAGIRVRRAAATTERIEPDHFAIPHDAELALRSDPPDIVIASDLSAPAYAALRLRQTGLGYGDTLFVVFCHGTRRWILEMSRRLAVRDLQSVLATSVLERAALELADVVVSPSQYLVGWMREQGWQLPKQTVVIPYFTYSGATGKPSVQPAPSESEPVRRLAFFGRLEDKKGVRLLIDAANGLASELLAKVELEFVGKPTATWTPERIEFALSDPAKRALRGFSFETSLDQPDALAHLSRPGTLVLIPSLGDNSPNTVYECFERGIRFMASAVGGIPELIRAEDRQHVLFEPTVEGLLGALRGALAGSRPNVSARPAFDAEASAAAWTRVIATRPERATMDESGASGSTHALLLDGDDVADDELVAILQRAQAATGADVVTCGTRVRDNGRTTLHFFSGEPGGLGALGNDYGTVAFVRRDLLDAQTILESGSSDRQWALLAGLAADGVRMVSIPLPLVTAVRPPATALDSPTEALRVLERLEQSAPDQLRQLPRLAAGLSTQGGARSSGDPSPSVIRRAARSLVGRVLARVR
jgi:glycosyltransferase involved in cell wall biosynthesis